MIITRTHILHTHYILALIFLGPRKLCYELTFGNNWHTEQSYHLRFLNPSHDIMYKCIRILHMKYISYVLLKDYLLGVSLVKSLSLLTMVTLQCVILSHKKPTRIRLLFPIRGYMPRSSRNEAEKVRRGRTRSGLMLQSVELGQSSVIIEVAQRGLRTVGISGTREPG